MRTRYPAARAAVLALFACRLCLPADDPPPAAADPIDRRVFGVLPNYRTADGSLPFEPISARRKMHIALKDSTDWPVIPTAAAFASLYHLEDQNPSFGQGMKGYSKRFLAAYGDQAAGNFMTEGIMPSLLREDPRYFRRGQGTVKSRLLYAATRIFVCKTDGGTSSFNFAEVLGNGAAASIGNLYYKDARGAAPTAQRWAVALATDSLSQIGKEFWPDIKRRFFRPRTRP